MNFSFIFLGFCLGIAANYACSLFVVKHKKWQETDACIEEGSRFKAVTIPDKGTIIAIWSGNEGWKTDIRKTSYTVPLFESEHLQGIPEAPCGYSMHYVTSMDHKALGFYALL